MNLRPGFSVSVRKFVILAFSFLFETYFKEIGSSLFREESDLKNKVKIFKKSSLRKLLLKSLIVIA